MTLTSDDLKALKELIDERLDIKLEEKLEQKLETKLNEKLQPIYEFIDFAKTALISLLDESQENFEQNLPQRVKKLEDLHPSGHHAS